MTTFRSQLRYLFALGALVISSPAALAAGPTGTWQLIDSPPPVKGLDGKIHKATCSGFPGTDPTFRFWARKNPASKNLMVYFEGGGACWDNLTCSNPMTGGSQPLQFFVPSVPSNAGPETADGIFRMDRPDNPVRDWNVVYVPYCTGDLHSGAATKTYTSVGNPALGLPAGVPVTINHRGFSNTMVALDWARKSFGKPERVLVAGVSAGGYGATANSPWVGRAFPHSRLYVLADSSQGVTTSTFDTGMPGRESWNPQLAPWVFGSNPDQVAGNDLLRRAAWGQPLARFAQYTPAFDDVQISFYGLMKQFYGPGGSCPNPAIDWYQQMSKKLVVDALTAWNYRFYVAAIPNGPFHTVLRGPEFYSETSAGQSLTSWIDAMLDGVGPLPFGLPWLHRACPTCIVPLPCS